MFTFRTDREGALDRIEAARGGHPLWPGARTSTIINRILGEIELLEFRGVAVHVEYVPGHWGVEGNELADMMAFAGERASQRWGYGYAEWQQEGTLWPDVDREWE